MTQTKMQLMFKKKILVRFFNSNGSYVTKCTGFISLVCIFFKSVLTVLEILNKKNDFSILYILYNISIFYTYANYTYNYQQ